MDCARALILAALMLVVLVVVVGVLLKRCLNVAATCLGKCNEGIVTSYLMLLDICLDFA